MDVGVQSTPLVSNVFWLMRQSYNPAFGPGEDCGSWMTGTSKPVNWLKNSARSISPGGGPPPVTSEGGEHLLD